MSTVKIRRSGTTTSTPSSLDHGELAINYADSKLFWKDASNTIQSFVFQAYATATHTHSADAITSGTVAYARLPVGSTTSTVCAGDDARLSNARTPTAHKASHATGGSDALTPSDIGAAPAASPTFTGTVTASGTRPVTIYSDSNDAVVKRGGTGGWAFAYAAEGSSGTNRGGYGFFGTADALTYYYIGSAYNTATVYVTTTGVGIGSSRTSPASALDVNGVITVSATSGSAGSYLPSVCFASDANTGLGQVGGADTVSLITAGSERVRVRADGNVGVGYNGAATHRFGVSGNISGAGTNLIYVAGGTAQSAVTSLYGVWCEPSVAADCSLTVLAHYHATQGTVSGTVTTQYGVLVSSTLTGATNNYGFYSNIASATGRWNFFANGTAQNYFAGNVGIGASRTTPSSALDVNGVITVAAGSAAAPAIVASGDSNTGLLFPAADTVAISTAGSERLRVRSDGNVGLGGSGSGNVGLFHQYTMSSASTRYGDLVQPTISAASTSNVVLFAAQSIMAASATSSNVTGYEALGASMGASAAITNQRGFVVGASFTQGTNNYAFSSSVPAGANRWNIYADGTAQNHFAGNVGIGSGNTAPAAPLHVVGETKLIGPITEGRVVGGNTSTAKTIALTNGTLQDYTLTGNCTFTMPTVTAGQSFTLMLRTGAGSYTATFTGVKWPGGTAPTVTTTASRMDLLAFVSDGTNWYGSVVQGYTP